MSSLDVQCCECWERPLAEKTPILNCLPSEHGLATHFVPSVNLPKLLDRLTSLDSPSYAQINEAIEEHYSEPLPEEKSNSITGDRRVALDAAFGHNSVEEILEHLKQFTESPSKEVGDWAKASLAALDLRSPTSLRVALEAVRRGRRMTLEEVFQMELGIATAFLVRLTSFPSHRVPHHEQTSR